MPDRRAGGVMLACAGRDACADDDVTPPNVRKGSAIERVAPHIPTQNEGNSQKLVEPRLRWADGEDWLVMSASQCACDEYGFRRFYGL
jgi:hypothetical protein